MTSMSDSGGETVISTSGQSETGSRTGSGKVVPTVSESLESMAMMGQGPPAVSVASATGLTCRGCGMPVEPSDRFCPHCGLDL